MHASVSVQQPDTISQQGPCQPLFAQTKRLSLSPHWSLSDLSNNSICLCFFTNRTIPKRGQIRWEGDLTTVPGSAASLANPRVTMRSVRVGSAASVLKGDILKEGWLVKSPPLPNVRASSRKKWRRRWFCLKVAGHPFPAGLQACVPDATGDGQSSSFLSYGALPICQGVHFTRRHAGYHDPLLGVKSPCTLPFLRVSIPTHDVAFTACLRKVQ